MGNTVNALVLEDRYSNRWDNGYPNGGNYWSDYTGDDWFWGVNQDEIGCDEIGDIPYPVALYNQDNYPLMKPWNIISVTVDIKPGSTPNSINLKSRGVVPVAVLTTGDFDAGLIDTDEVMFAGAYPQRETREDIDGDGDLDIVFHFKTQDLNLDESSVEATLVGVTYEGLPLEGTDTVNIVPSKSKKK